MEIEKNIPFDASKVSKTGKALEIVRLFQVGDSTLVEADKLESSYWRSAIDYAQKKLGTKMKFKLKKWDEKNYRIWRTK